VHGRKRRPRRAFGRAIGLGRPNGSAIQQSSSVVQGGVVAVGAAAAVEVGVELGVEAIADAVADAVADVATATVPASGTALEALEAFEALEALATGEVGSTVALVTAAPPLFAGGIGSAHATSVTSATSAAIGWPATRATGAEPCKALRTTSCMSAGSTAAALSAKRRRTVPDVDAISPAMQAISALGAAVQGCASWSSSA
jgi:hypothetical protein